MTLKAVLMTAILGLSGLWPISQAQSAEIADKCDCPVIECGPCEDQESLKFVAEKCMDRNRIKTRSCKQPVCVQKPELPEQCVALRSPKPDSNLASTSARPDQASELGLKTILAGSVMVVKGMATVVRKGAIEAVKVSDKIYVGDTLETGDDSRITVILTNRHSITVTSNSKLKMTEHTENADVHKTTLNLLYGKVRTFVDPNNKIRNDFKVKSPTAVAGVRGTDFMTSYDFKTRATKVETISGLVELSNPSGQKRIMIPKGKYASYVVPSGTSKAIEDSDISNFVDRGFMTDVKVLADKDIRRIDSESTDQRLAAQASSHICEGPQGELNQCAFKLRGSECVRTRCNANGEWAEETRMPASEARCPDLGITVGSCGY